MITRAATVMVLFGMVVTAQRPPGTWLDRPLSNWNVAGGTMPRAPATAETTSDVAKRCALQTIAGTRGEQEVARAGWVPFHMFDRQIVQRDVEIVGGLAGADGMCRPRPFNVFVFVGGTLAGTLSPTEMASRSDGTIGGAIRLADDDTIAAEFARYAEPDPLCCPTDRVTVRYRIDRTSIPPVLVPLVVAPTRR